MRMVAAEFPCPTADTETLPRIVVEGDTATLAVVDYKLRSWTIEFSGVVGLRYEAAVPAGLRDDEAYEVLESDWLAELGPSTRPLRHFIICFNEGGGICISIAFETFESVHVSAGTT